MVAKPRKPFLLRVSPEVLAAVERLAAGDAQMEVLLREALTRRGIKPKPPKDGQPVPVGIEEQADLDDPT
jgi:hypothetical protein